MFYLLYVKENNSIENLNNFFRSTIGLVFYPCDARGYILFVYVFDDFLCKCFDVRKNRPK